MDSDEDMHQIDTDLPSLSSLDKGKGKAVLYDESEDKSARRDDTLPWVEKYRPVTLDDVVSHKDITGTIERFIEKNRLPHLLFYGPPGTGKTSTIIAVARRIYGPTFRKQILELNASDDRGIDVVREQIKQFAETRTLFAKGFKLIILDEADMMTTAAQAALRRSIQSRCTRFRFSPLPIVEVQKRLNHVVEAERPEIYTCTGSPHPSDIEAIINSMLSEEFTASHQNTIEFPPAARVYLLDQLATTEYRLSAGADERIQLTALLGAFKNAVELTAKAKSKE
ncbi:P-loop containing nucleoside triphosphate hydrolase protein [Lactarius sanguifluus]|nr:P-loop containing nucleoside triphosphate hydrolase protein [Lactarius sanguifluus]